MRVLLLGERAIPLAGLHYQLAQQGIAAFVRDATTAARVLELAAALHPDVVLIDAPRECRAFLLCHELKQSARPPRVVLYVAEPPPGLEVAAWAAGADGMATASTPACRLAEIVAAVASGGRRLPRPPIAAVRAAGLRLSQLDLSIFGMRMHGVPAHEISGALRADPLEVDRRMRLLVETLTD